MGVLRDGVIPAGGFLLNTSGPIPASGIWAAEVASREHSPDNEGPSEPTATAEDVPAAPAAPPVPATPPPAPVTNGAVVAEPVAWEHDSAEAPVEEPAAPEPASTDQTAGAGGMFARIDQRTPEPETPPPLPLETPAPVAPTLASGRPQLRGVHCPAGHLANPLRTTCQTCGARLDPAAPHVLGDRPVLGTITFDDGAVLGIDRPAAIGSDVPSGYEIDGELATIVRLDDGAGGIAPVQLEVRVRGWDVEVVDMQSMGGTYTSVSGERQTRTKLRPSQSVVLEAGMTVETGGRRFVFNHGVAALA